MKNKVALVTGGTGGIGRATALEFARRGAKVVVTGRRETEGRKTVDLIVKGGGEAFFILADVSKEEDCKRMVEFTLEKCGRLDYAFNNAGTEGKNTLVTEFSVENYQSVMNTNVLGVFLSMKYEIPAILKNGGAIVNNGSVASVIGMAGVSVYMASKHAVAGLTKCAALEWSAKGVRINMVSPAAIETDMLDRFAGTAEIKESLKGYHPIGRVGRPEEVAKAAVFLCSDDSSFITGENLMVDGGFTAQ